MTRKVMTLNKELYPESDIERLYVSGCKICVANEESSLGWYVKSHIEPLIVALRPRNTIPSLNATHPNELKKHDEKQRMNNWQEKAMYGQYLREMEGKLKGCMATTICSAQ